MKHLIKLLCLLAGLAWSSVQGASLPAHYPQEGFQRTGVIDGVDLAKRQILVNDFRYYLSEDATLHSLSGSSDSLARLHPGNKIGFSFGLAGKRHVITEMWMLPSYYGESRE
jgi:hypothetical protein